MDSSTSSPRSALLSVGIFFWELIKVFLLAMVIIFPIRYFLIQPFFVRGSSMEPNFQDGEYLIVDELSYQFREPRRGEVIVFRYPGAPSQFYIKRIIGLPGETVQIKDGQVILFNTEHPQGVILDESDYLPSSTRTGGVERVSIDGKQYFVLGDNRAASSDSRSWGLLPHEDIIGRAWVRAFPFNRFDVLTFGEPGFINL